MKVVPHAEFGFTVETKNTTPRLMEQVHGADIIFLAGEYDVQNAIDLKAKADGVATAVPNVEIYVFTADCLPVLFMDPNPENPIAAIHCGWRGAKNGIVRRAVDNWPSRDFYAVLGPSIKECCFEVKQDFVDQWRKAKLPVDEYLTTRDDKRYFNLTNYIVENDLKDIPTKNIIRSENRCTVCSQPELPSFRRTKGTDTQIKSWVKKLG